MNDPTSTSENSRRRGVFEVDVDKALGALALAWGDDYDEIWYDKRDGQWGAHHKDAGDDDVLTGPTPDALNRAIRARLDMP